MSRKARKIFLNFPHHVVQRGNNKKRVFKDSKDRKYYLRLLEKYRLECACKIHAYCLMSNHIHILITPLNKDSLSSLMHRINTSYTIHINRKYNRSGRLWSSRFFSIPIDNEKYLWAVCRYIEQNPLRSGITEDITKYLFSSARINCGLREPGFIQPVWKDYFDLSEYRRLLLEPLSKKTEDKIRKYTNKSLPLM